MTSTLGARGLNSEENNFALALASAVISFIASCFLVSAEVQATKHTARKRIKYFKTTRFRSLHRKRAFDQFYFF